MDGRTVALLYAITTSLARGKNNIFLMETIVFGFKYIKNILLQQFIIYFGQILIHLKLHFLKIVHAGNQYHFHHNHFQIYKKYSIVANYYIFCLDSDTSENCSHTQATDIIFTNVMMIWLLFTSSCTILPYLILKYLLFVSYYI